MRRCQRSVVIAAAEAILARGGWCVLEACTDVPRQRWEGRAVFFHRTAEAVLDAVEEELAVEPDHDARLTGCNRHTLTGDDELGAYLIYLAGAGPGGCAVSIPTRHSRRGQSPPSPAR